MTQNIFKKRHSITGGKKHMRVLVIKEKMNGIINTKNQKYESACTNYDLEIYVILFYTENFHVM